MNNRLYYLSRGQMNAIYGIQSMQKTKISQFKSNKIISNKNSGNSFKLSIYRRYSNVKSLPLCSGYITDFKNTEDKLSDNAYIIDTLKLCRCKRSRLTHPTTNSKLSLKRFITTKQLSLHEYVLMFSNYTLSYDYDGDVINYHHYLK